MPKRIAYKAKSKTSYSACGKMVWGDAKKALKIAQSVKALLNVEVKNFDIQQTVANMSTTPFILQLSNIPQGDTTSTRDGNQLKTMGLELGYSLIVNATLPRTIVRIIVVCDKQTNQAIYNIDDLLEDSSAGDNIVSPYNLNNRHRFNIIYDRVHSLSLAEATVTVKRYLAFSKLIRFDASTSAIADLTQNSISMVQMTNEPTNVPAITSFLRLRYVDN